MMMTDTDIQKAISEALEQPDSFAYFGDLPLFESWGFTGFSVHRDADALEQSNWEVISDDLLTRFPDDFDVLNSSHWAVGWVDQLLVRVLDDTGKPTEAFLAAVRWQDELADYPVADENDYYLREREEFEGALRLELEYLERQHGAKFDADLPDVIQWLFEGPGISSADELTSTLVEEGLRDLGLLRGEV